MDERDLVAEARQEQRLLQGGVATADDEDVLVAEEGAVACCARRDAAALEPLLGVEPEPARARAGGDDHGPRGVLRVLDPDAEGTLGEVDARHVVGDELCPEALGLAAEVGHHLRPHDPVGVAGVVLHVARDHQLAAPVEALDHERRKVRARCVKRSRIPRGAAADDDQIAGLVVHVHTVINDGAGGAVPRSRRGAASKRRRPGGR